MIFPTLFKKNSTGKIQYWTISVEGIEILTKFGQVDGKEQYTVDVIKGGKNIGRSNATTTEEQAVAETTAKWEKQLKKGYVDNLRDAEQGKLDKLIEGGINPMLAHKFNEHGHKIEWPAICSAKLDGVRIVATIKDGKCCLWTRTRKPVNSLPHIVRELEILFPVGEHVVDGEAYNHDFKDNFEKIISLVRQEEPAPDHYLVFFWVFDYYSVDPTLSFTQRWEQFGAQFKRCDFYPHIQPINQIITDDHKTMEALHEMMCKEGFEGVMVRNKGAPYEFKRSYHLQKVKNFLDEEFVIIGIEEGRGKLQGHVAAFVCRTSAGKEFKAKMKGELENLRLYFENHSLWKGKKLTVRYQNLTSDGIPRFPVGISIREGF